MNPHAALRGAELRNGNCAESSPLESKQCCKLVGEFYGAERTYSMHLKILQVSKFAEFQKAFLALFSMLNTKCKRMAQTPAFVSESAAYDYI
jgi:hypothetical protein